MSSPTTCPASSAVTKNSCPFNSADQEPENVSIVTAVENSPTTKNKGVCPFKSMTKDDDEDMMTQSFGDHPITHVKINTVNHFVPESKSKMNQEYLSDPQLASAMKTGTKVLHSAAENSVFTKRFLKGSIRIDEYGRYINSLYFIYKTMEDLLDQHKENPIIELVYFPFELARVSALIKDLEYYYGKDRVAQLTDFNTATPAVKTYVKALKDAAEKNPALLIAHSYSRYLGDISGGQILAKILKKHVLKRDVTDATWDSHRGLEFYNFDHINSYNEFKILYRQRLDKSPVTQYVKDLVVAEAILAFELNIALFDEIQALSDTNALNSTLNHDDTESNDASTNETKTILVPNADWIVGFATGAATFAVCLSIYHHISERL